MLIVFHQATKNAKFSFYFIVAYISILCQILKSGVVNMIVYL